MEVTFKDIMHSKRYHIFYIEHCRVLANNKTVEYITSKENINLYYNIPIANTSFILLGPGTSITNEAIRLLSKAGVLIGFTSEGGLPLFANTDKDFDIDFITPTSEYRASSYIIKFIPIFYDDNKRLNCAKILQNKRANLVIKLWHQNYSKYNINFNALKQSVTSFLQEIDKATTQQDLLLCEARYTKKLYSIITTAFNITDFIRNKEGNSKDLANSFLDHGNYLAYGLGATAAWVLGIPFALSVLHGKTRRGALVFDLADIIKDAIVMPLAFSCATEGYDDKDYRLALIEYFYKTEALDTIIDTFKEAINICS